MPSATAVASPNIAFIKYWGNRDHEKRLPANGSISMTLKGLETRCRVAFDPDLTEDLLYIQGERRGDAALFRTSSFLNHIRRLTGTDTYAIVESENNFPEGTGIASSASAFAAMAIAGLQAGGLNLQQHELSKIARLGSGSASRSIFGGFVEMETGEFHDENFSHQIAPPEHWTLIDLILILRREKKRIGSSEGHTLAESSPLQLARVNDAPRRLALCREAILKRDFGTLAEIVELDSNLMHAVMMTSAPPLFYWEPATLGVMKLISQLRAEGISVCYTIDAGSTVHCLCEPKDAEAAELRLRTIPGVIEILRSQPGEAAQLL